MKNYVCGVLLLALMACSRETTTTTTTTETTETTAVTETTATETSTAAPTATETTATTAATGTTAAAAPKTTQEKKTMAQTNEKVAEIHTSAGQINIRFFPDLAPNHVKNFLDLAEKGFYNGTKFHRVIPGFMIQGGDPNTKTDNVRSWGTGGSGTNVRAEFNSVSHKRGIVSMARSSDPNSASSQFFIVVKDSTFLDNQYTVFGVVTKGMDVADKIVNAPRGEMDRPNNPVAIEKVVVRPARDDERGSTPR